MNPTKAKTKHAKDKKKTKPKTQLPKIKPPLRPAICKLCKGAGCCVLCDESDEWEDMLYCSNGASFVIPNFLPFSTFHPNLPSL